MKQVSNCTVLLARRRGNTDSAPPQETIIEIAQPTQKGAMFGIADARLLSALLFHVLTRKFVRHASKQQVVDNLLSRSRSCTKNQA